MGATHRHNRLIGEKALVDGCAAVAREWNAKGENRHLCSRTARRFRDLAADRKKAEKDGKEIKSVKRGRPTTLTTEEEDEALDMVRASRAGAETWLALRLPCPLASVPPLAVRS